jgi:hypothetical protein
VVNRDVAAAVAVDVANIAVGDDAASVGLADGETGCGAVEELFTWLKSATFSQSDGADPSNVKRHQWLGILTHAVVHAGASIVCQVGDMGWVSENGNGND